MLDIFSEEKNRKARKLVVDMRMKDYKCFKNDGYRKQKQNFMRK